MEDLLQDYLLGLKALSYLKNKTKYTHLPTVQISYKYKKDLIYRNLTNGNNTKYHY